MIRRCSFGLRLDLALRTGLKHDRRSGGHDADQNKYLHKRKHDDATHSVEVTWTVDVDVTGSMERKDEQNLVAFLVFKTSTITTTLEHSSGVRLRAPSSCTGEARMLLAAKAATASVLLKSMTDRGKDTYGCLLEVGGRVVTRNQREEEGR